MAVTALTANWFARTAGGHAWAGSLTWDLGAANRKI